MHYENAVYPNDEQMAGFAEAGPDGPIYMVNLLRYRDRAEYPDGGDRGLSGQEAYMIYANAVGKLIQQFGGELQFSGKVTRLMLGEVEDLWDDVGIAMYPDRAAMLAMMSSDSMQEIGVHRAAGLAGQLNIETIASPEWQAADNG
jgi:uncharacterized protein (DUF1330 family)